MSVPGSPLPRRRIGIGGPTSPRSSGPEVTPILETRKTLSVEVPSSPRRIASTPLTPREPQSPVSPVPVRRIGRPSLKVNTGPGSPLPARRITSPLPERIVVPTQREEGPAPSSPLPARRLIPIEKKEEVPAPSSPLPKRRITSPLPARQIAPSSPLPARRPISETKEAVASVRRITSPLPLRKEEVGNLVEKKEEVMAPLPERKEPSTLTLRLDGMQITHAVVKEGAVVLTLSVERI